MESAEGIAEQSSLLEAVGITGLKLVIDLRKSDVQIAGINWRVAGQRGGRGVFHEFGIKCAADGHNGKAVLVSEFGEGERRIRKPMRAQAGDDINDGGRLWLHPEG